VRRRDATGFSTVLVNGVPTAVSGTNPLSVTVNGVANTVTAVNVGTKTLTLGTAVTRRSATPSSPPTRPVAAGHRQHALRPVLDRRGHVRCSAPPWRGCAP
jgi:hypothetical protein